MRSRRDAVAISTRLNAVNSSIKSIVNIMNFIDLNSELHGTDKGQVIFDSLTKRLSFPPGGVKVFTGIGYVFTQARDYLPFSMVPGTKHELYNPDPETGKKRKLYLDKYDFDSYFATKEFKKYPDCDHIIICDWNRSSIEMILAILEGAPEAFRGKQITVIHGDITAKETIDKMKEIADGYEQNINTIYFTNIFNDFNEEIISLYRRLSKKDILLICDHANLQHVAHTRTGGRKTKRRRRYKRTIRF